MNEAVHTLVKEFISASTQHFEATSRGDYEAANQEADRVHAAFLKLRDLGPPAREALMAVAQGSNADAAAAVMAAAYSLKYDPNRALAALGRLARDKGVLGFQASQAIKRWKSGEWHLE